MKIFAISQFVMVVVSLVLTTTVHAQDMQSYYNRNLPKMDNAVLSVADNVRGLAAAYSMLGKKVGNGQCTDLVKMAMGYAGARPGDFRDYRNYVWGARVTGQTRPGDIIQFENCIFRWTSGNSWGESKADHHTAIIMSRNGSVLSLIEQNANGGPVSMSTLDLSWKQSGTYTIWRPVMW